MGMRQQQTDRTQWPFELNPPGGIPGQPGRTRQWPALLIFRGRDLDGPRSSKHHTAKGGPNTLPGAEHMTSRMRSLHQVSSTDRSKLCSKTPQCLRTVQRGKLHTPCRRHGFQKTLVISAVALAMVIGAAMPLIGLCAT